MVSEEIKEILWISGLKNALKFDGKPNKKAIMGKLMAKMPELRPQARQIIPELDQVIVEIENLTLEQQRDKLLELDPHALDKVKTQEEEKELPPLPNLEDYDKVVMRLAPYPSGALHIGNARMVVLNDEYVKKYNGELILFYDDTIGSPKSQRDSPKAKYVLPEAYDLIKEGLEWLGVKYSKVYYKSDRIEIFYEYCEKLIQENMAYVCFCSAKDFKEKYKNIGKECPHRDSSISKNIEEWKNMLNRKYGEGDAVVRLKTGMDQRDPALRDQIIMRISEAEHPRVGTKYTVWPMLEFSWAIDDYLIGVSHIIRGIDLVKEGIIEEFIWDHFGWKKAQLLYYGRIKFPNMELSKTKTRNKIQEGEYNSWGDPRTWSLQSLKSRGIEPGALRQSLLNLGMSQSGITFSEDWLYRKNIEIIDEISDRYFYVENPVSLLVEEVPFLEFIAEPPLYPKKPERGKRKIRGVVKDKKITLYISRDDANKLKAGEIIRLKDCINIQILSVDLDNNRIIAYHHSIEVIQESKKIQWVPEEENVQVKILKPDGTFSKGFGEINLLDIPMNKVIQFERYGFVNPIRIENNELLCYFTH